MADMNTHIEALIAKAASADQPQAAMLYAQAALNAAKALCDLRAAEIMNSPPPR